MAERYNTPEQGTLDWHVPLNENFNLLDNHVEIRDADANKSNYAPADGAKFLATDTEIIYLGDGNQWQVFADLSQIGTSDDGSSTDTGVIVAQPGDVQAALDTAYSAGGGTVRLDPSQRYVQPSSPWVVKSGVVLDFNGAVVHGDGALNDTDFIHLWAGGQLWHPHLDWYDGGDGYDASNQYNGVGFRLDTGFGGDDHVHGFYFAQGTRIWNGHIQAVGGGGTACKCAVTDSAKGSAITHLFLDYDIDVPELLTHEQSVARGLHLSTAGVSSSTPRGYINGVEVRGNWRYPIGGILQEGPGSKRTDDDNVQQVRNYFRIQMQGGDGAKYGWKITGDATWAEYNVFEGHVWDTRNYDGHTWWKINSTFDRSDVGQSYQACKDNAVRVYDTRDGIVSNSSGRDQYVFHRVTRDRKTF